MPYKVDMPARTAKVPLFGNVARSATITLGATVGAQIGVDLLMPDGSIATTAKLVKLFGSTPAADTSIDTTDDVDEGAYHLYFTDERAQDAVGGTLTNSANVTLTYDDAGNTITADLTDVTVTAGGTLQKYGFDAKGRLSQQGAATTTNLTEGSNLYYTDVRADARISLQKGQPLGLATLDAGGKLDAGQLPALAITETFVVNTQAAMLALAAQEGDVAVRTDLSKSFILTAAPATTLANWQELLTPMSPVTSVFGRVGSVTAASGDYTFAQIGGKPTTLAGYGITDAASAAQGALADTALQPGDAIPASDVSGLAAVAISGSYADLSDKPDIPQGVPYIVATGDIYAVPLGIQALWTIPIELEGTASLDISGALVEVA